MVPVCLPASAQTPPFDWAPRSEPKTGLDQQACEQPKASIARLESDLSHLQRGNGSDAPRGARIRTVPGSWSSGLNTQCGSNAERLARHYASAFRSRPVGRESKPGRLTYCSIGKVRRIPYPGFSLSPSFSEVCVLYWSLYGYSEEKRLFTTPP